LKRSVVIKRLGYEAPALSRLFSCHQAAWLWSTRRLGNLRYIIRRFFIASGRRRGAMDESLEEKLRFEGKS
jgi:hypothetical protein